MLLISNLRKLKRLENKNEIVKNTFSHLIEFTNFGHFYDYKQKNKKAWPEPVPSSSTGCGRSEPHDARRD